MNTRRMTASLAAAMAATCLAGCLERQITITSDPPGAIVRLNDYELGRTPVTTQFKEFGVYDVQLELDGYEPLSTSKNAKAPVYEWPGVDLVAMAIPARFKTNFEWHFVLEPSLETSTDPAQLEADLIERALEMKAQTTPPEDTDANE